MKSGPKPKPVDNSNIDPLGVWLLYDDYRGTAINASVRFCKSHPEANLPWVVQECLIALYMAARKHDRKFDNTFAAYSKMAVVNALLAYEKRNAGQRLEVPADEVIAHNEDSEPVTRGELAERNLVEDLIPYERELCRLYDLREAVETCPELTRIERRALTLRFFHGVDTHELPKRLKLPGYSVARASRSAIQKLRQHFSQRGYTVSDRPLTGIFNGGGYSVGRKINVHQSQRMPELSRGIRSSVIPASAQ